MCDGVVNSMEIIVTTNNLMIETTVINMRIIKLLSREVRSSRYDE